MSDTIYGDSEFIVNDNNTIGGYTSDSEILGGGNLIKNLLSACVIILVVMILVSFVMPRKHKKPNKVVHNHLGCVNHGKVFDSLLVPSTFYDPKKQGFKYINWNVNS